EPVPTEPENDTAERTERQVVRRQWAATVALELPSEARSEHDAAGESDDATDGVHDSRTGEVTEEDAVVVVDETGEPTHRITEPSARTPDPVAEDGVDETRHHHAVEDVALEARTADERTGRHRRRRVGERELEQEERQERDLRARVRGIASLV